MVWAARIVEGKIASEPRAGLGDVVVRMQIDLLVLDGAPEPLDEDVVTPRAASMLIRIACWRKRFRKSALVNCEP